MLFIVVNKIYFKGKNPMIIIDTKIFENIDHFLEYNYKFVDLRINE